MAALRRVTFLAIPAVVMVPAVLSIGLASPMASAI